MISERTGLIRLLKILEDTHANPELFFTLRGQLTPPKRKLSVHPRQFTCSSCGKEYWGKQKHKDGKCTKCQRYAFRIEWGKKHRIPTETRTCLHCGKEYKATTDSKIYCSYQCRYAATGRHSWT